MKAFRISRSIALLCGLAIAVVSLGRVQGDEAAAGDWAQWRGPARDGISAEKAWLKAWPRVRLKPRWSRKIGNGYSAVSVVGERAWTMGYLANKDTVFCLDTKSGKFIWSYTYPCAIYDNMNAGGPSATPAVSAGLVVTMSREGVAHCLAADTGKLVWKKDFKASHSAKIPTWGFSGSALIRGDRVIIDVGVIVCLELKTGKEVWKTKNYQSGYSSPVPFAHKGKQRLAVFPAYGLVILDEASGAEIAKTRWKTSYDINAATPVIVGDEIFISSGYNTGAALYDFDGKSLKQRWKIRAMRNHMASCIRWKDYIYGFDESRLRCLDAKTGKEMWSQRGLGKGSLMMSAGTLVVLSERGELVIAKASPKAFKAAARRKVLAASGCWTAPVLAHDRIYCRSARGELVCVDVKAK